MRTGTTPKNLADWVEYINTLHVREIDLGLSRVAALAQSLSLTAFSCPVIMVGGTNGKGSVVRFIENIYATAGYRVAAYTSPHLLTFNERLRLEGKDVADERLIAAFEYIEKHRGAQPLTFFEFTTLAMLYICQQTVLDVLILEVGLGGRLDAVNVVQADVAVITGVALDHMNFLGGTRESIGREKVGIARSRKPLVCGDSDPPQSIMQAVQCGEIPFFCLGKTFFLHEYEDHWEWRGPHLSYLRLPLPTLKIENAATSLMVIDLLQSLLPVTQFAVITGIKTAQLAGRFEVIQSRVPIIFDVAHNPQAVQYLRTQLQRQPIAGETRAVVGMLGDKDIEGCLQLLMDTIERWYVADLHAQTARGAKSSRLTNYLTTKTQKNCYNFASVGGALAQALADCGPADRIVVFGSFYTVALAKQYVVSEKEKVYGS